jgi:hypothetical protein
MKHSTSSATKEKQIKSTLRFHFTPSRMAIVKKTTRNAGKHVRKRNHYTLLAGMQISAVTMEIGMEVPQNTKTGTTI